MIATLKALLLLTLLSCAPSAVAQQQTTPVADVPVSGSISELRSMRHVLLLVRRSAVVDVRGPANSILTEAYRPDPDAPKRYPRTYNTIARRLNKYMVKYKSISGARNLAEAEFIILFNLLEYRRPLGYSYPYGELYVILNGRSNSKPPRIVWKTRKNPVWVEDAINEFIRELKATRGEV